MILKARLPIVVSWIFEIFPVRETSWESGLKTLNTFKTLSILNLKFE